MKPVRLYYVTCVAIEPRARVDDHAERLELWRDRHGATATYPVQDLGFQDVLIAYTLFLTCFVVKDWRYVVGVGRVTAGMH